MYKIRAFTDHGEIRSVFRSAYTARSVVRMFVSAGNTVLVSYARDGAFNGFQRVVRFA